MFSFPLKIQIQRLTTDGWDLLEPSVILIDSVTYNPRTCSDYELQARALSQTLYTGN